MTREEAKKILPIIQASGLPVPTAVVEQQQAQAKAEAASPKMPGQGMDDKMPVPPSARPGGQNNGPQQVANGASSSA